MLVTEEEAREKWCFEVRYFQQDGDTFYSSMGNLIGKGQFEGCIASKCPAWRWSEHDKKCVENSLDLPGVTMADVRGYCGLAGKAEGG